MRKVSGVLFAVAMVMPIGIAASPAGAAVKTTCKTASGTATFTPALPKIGSATKVLTTVKIVGGKFGGCTGGGVTSAKVVATIKFTIKSNCTTLSKGAATGAKGPETITWNNSKTSTVTLSLTAVKGKMTQSVASGPVTAGLFKGFRQSGTLNYTIPKDGQCSTKGLSKVTFKQVTLQVIK